jgi:tetratricopeptide (TPR) repeat protein
LTGFDYKAFISYSHSDDRAAAWLQRQLESYRVPSRLVGKKTSVGSITRRIGAIFRDRDELPAGGNLSETLNAALANSEFLIVICSPRSRQSRWVDLEIEEFRRTHAASNILCLIVDGEPLSGNDPTREHLECFPKALGFLERDAGREVAAETIAADIREGGDGKRLARLKIISGLLGLGLDELIQRDAQRKHRTLLLATLASLSGMFAMAALSFVAIEARNSEKLRRAEAEDLIEFMLSDLRDRLDAVGRLDVLDAVGEKAVAYYSNVKLEDHSESSLGRRARAFHLLGEVDDLEGNMESARASFEQAYQSTRELLTRSPNDGERIFNHAQSVFWVGYLDWRLGNNRKAESAFREYIELSALLSELVPDRADWVAESGHANINMGVFEEENGSIDKAIEHFQAARSIFQQVERIEPDNSEWQILLARSHAWLADSFTLTGSIDLATEHRQLELDIFQRILVDEPNNQQIKSYVMVSIAARAELAMHEGGVETAIANLESAAQIGRQLMQLDSGNTFISHTTGSVLADLGVALSFNGDHAAGANVLNDAESIAGLLLAEDSNVLEWQYLWHKIQLEKARLSLLSNDTENIVQILNVHIENLATLESANPTYFKIRYLLASAIELLRKYYASNGLGSFALEQSNMIITQLAGTTESLPPRQLATLARAYEDIGDTEAAGKLMSRLEKLNYRHP